MPKKKPKPLNEVKLTLRLWKAVEETNPEYTKKVAFGKRKFTSADPYRQFERATEMLDVYGIGWRIENQNYKMFEACGKLHCLFTGEFVFQWQTKSGRFPIVSDITITEGKDGMSYKKDWSKIVTTDALTKGLSMLGFNTDIFFGKFDDNKYVREMTDKFKEESKSSKAKPKKKPWDTCDGDCDDCKHYDECPL